jgi:hypothetical protein
VSTPAYGLISWSAGAPRTKKKRSKAPGSYQDRPNGLPFEFLPNFWSDAEGTCAQIDIFNTSSFYAYSFTSLKLYKALSPVYWQTDQFDSPAAIATGTFQWDFCQTMVQRALQKRGATLHRYSRFLSTPRLIRLTIY